METMTEIGTEKRLDELSNRVDHGFAQIDQRFAQVDQRLDRVDADIRELRGDLKRGFEIIESRFDSLQRTIILVLGGAVTTLVGGAIAAAFAAFS
jgi:tetrahydromethanopterin S-methyltransferase subunit G